MFEVATPKVWMRRSLVKNTVATPTKRTNTNAMWMDLFFTLNLRDVKRPNDLREAEALALKVKDTWESNGRRPLVAAHRCVNLITNELIRLTKADGLDRDLANTFVNKLIDSASKDLKRHDLFDEVTKRMTSAVAPRQSQPTLQS